MNSVKIYSNLSLQVLKLKNVDCFYDEYFNFDIDTKSELSICVIMQTIKPVLDKDIFIEFISKNITAGKKIIIITEQINYFKGILYEYISDLQIFNFPSNIVESADISIKNLFTFQFPFSRKSGAILKSFIQNIIVLSNSPTIKAICLDFDNTLWQGTIGNENNLSNLFEKSDSSFLIFQNKLKELKNHGILLCLVTKNNRNDIESFFDKNKLMPLKLNDFITIKSNWEPKSNNIIEIYNELNINSDTFMYFDDSEFELEEVKVRLPFVRSYKVSASNLINLIALIPEFQEIISKNKNIDKTSSYRLEFQRKKSLYTGEVSSDPYNLESFQRLEVKLEIKNQNLDLDRISEMSEKTNQFNFNKCALSVYNLNELIKSQHMFFTCSAKDKYGDYGIIGYIHLNPDFNFENFVLSCRALSRGIEFKFVEHVLSILQLKEIVIKFKETSRNYPAKLFLEKNKKFPQKIIYCN
jgi:FkbH-like protein